MSLAYYQRYFEMPTIRSLVDYFRKSSGAGSNSDGIDPLADPEVSLPILSVTKVAYRECARGYNSIVGAT